MKYWYLFWIYECPVCGRGKEIKERQYSPKPIEPVECYKYIQQYDYCESL